MARNASESITAYVRPDEKDEFKTLLNKLNASQRFGKISLSQLGGEAIRDFIKKYKDKPEQLEINFTLPGDQIREIRGEIYKNKGY